MSRDNQADDANIRSAVEQWARASGVLYQGDREPPPGWRIEISGLGFMRICHHRSNAAWPNPSPHAALVWALVLEARPLRDGTRCKRCRGRGTWDEWRRGRYLPGSFRNADPRAHAQMIAADWEGDGFTVAVLYERIHASKTIPCPDCDGTGLADMTDAYVQHVLDAQPRPGANGIRFITYADTSSVVLRYRVDGADEDSIEALHVLADRLQAAGDPLGLDIAHLLAGESDRAAVGVGRLVWRTEQHRHSRSNTSAQVTALSHEP